MGNNNSHKSQLSSIDVVRQPPSRPNAPPSSRPVSELGPHGPSYHNPENQVLPRELPSILKLRPVSMELSKYNPDYENIFASQHIDSLDRNENNNTDNSSGGDTNKPNSLTSVPPPLVENGNIPITQMNTSLSHPPSSTLSNGYITLPAKAPYRPSHRRQMSLGQEHVIIEVSDENIENRVKLDPLMQSYPGAVAPSLPVKNNFNLDYSYQLTYVQLAEHRRNKTIEDLEKKTGRKVSDLSADLNEHTTTDNIFTPGAASSVSSKSDCTGGFAVSSKKKKAPAPPTQHPKSSVFQTTNSAGKVQATGKEDMVDNEPPIDYDIESTKNTATIKLSRHISVPNASKMESFDSKAPKVPPLPPNQVKFSAFKNQGAIISRSNSMSSGIPQIILKKAPDIKVGPKISESADGPIPWLQEIKTLSETRAAKRQQSATNLHILEIPKGNTVDENENNKNWEDKYEAEVDVSIKPKLVFQSSAAEFVPEMSQLKVITNVTNEATQLGDTVEKRHSLSEQAKPSSLKLKPNYSASVYDHQTPSELQHQTSFSERPTSGDQIRRLNSLLQHDIKAAANAKCVKLVKQITPTPPKPKDLHTVFREQLEKACAARNMRAKVEGTIDEKLQNISNNASFNSEKVDPHAKRNFESNNSFTPTTENDINKPKTLPKPQRCVKSVAVNHNSSSQEFVQGTMKNSDERQRNDDFDDIQIFTSLDWTPEVDLDSDDNLSDREEVTSKKTASNGFKSTVIPNAMLDLKAKTKGRNEKQNKHNENNLKNKIGSVKKFKKSVHNGVKNAFGSISKTTGKLLGRHKSEEFEVEEEPDRNWNVASNSRCSSMSVDMLNHRISNGDTAVDDVSNLKIECERNEPFNVGNENADVTSEEEGIDYDDDDNDDDESNNKSLQNGQQTDVVNLSSGRKNILKPNGEVKYDKSIESSNTGHSKRAKEMKKKYALEGTASRKQKDILEDKALKDARDKERMIEAERRKQLEKELEMSKIREAETIERLKRLEEAQLQQQLNVQLLQQQTQQQKMGILSAPQVPIAGNYQFYSSLPDATPLPGYSNPFGQQLPPNGYQPSFGLYSKTPFLNGSTAGHVPFDLNDYMRMLGMTSLLTPQQAAFFLDSMTCTGQPFDRKSNPIMFDVFNQQYPTGAINYQGLDTNDLKKQNFQNWVSTPNVHTAGTAYDSNVSLVNFVANYNGANNANDDEAEMTATPRNPLYDSDGSDDGLSPQRNLVSAQVKENRPIPGNYVSESNNFDFKSFSENSQNMFKPNQQTFISPSNSVTTPSNSVASDYNGSTSHSNSVATDDSSSTSTSTPSSPSLDAPSTSILASRSIKAPSGFRTIIKL